MVASRGPMSNSAWQTTSQNLILAVMFAQGHGEADAISDIDMTVLTKAPIENAIVLVKDLAASDHDKLDPRERWLTIVLAWYLDQREHIAEPRRLLEAVYADFDYPAVMEGLVGYMPAEDNGPVGEVEIYKRWRALVSALGGKVF